ncbi:TonB, partial [Pseudomonas syringae pv. coriandricola]
MPAHRFNGVMHLTNVRISSIRIFTKCSNGLFIALQLPEGALMNDAVIMKAVPGPSPDETSTAWQGIPFKANTSRPGGLNRPQVMVLIAASVLIHGVIWWYMQTAQPELPEVAPQVPEMTIELTSPTPPAPEPPPPEPPPP